MRRLFLALALLLSAAPALAAGAFVTRTEQTPSGALVTQYYDMSGTGLGPFLRVFVCADGNGAICAAGGGSGGTVNQGTPGSTAWPTTDTLVLAGVGTPSDAAAAVGGNGSQIAQLKQSVTKLDALVTAMAAIQPRQVFVSSQATTTYGIAAQVTTSGTSLAAKAAAGNNYGVYATNFTANAGFLVGIAATAAPSAGASITPMECVPIKANDTANVNYSPGPGDTFSTGLVFLLSTSCSTYTTTNGPSGFIKARAK